MSAVQKQLQPKKQSPDDVGVVRALDNVETIEESNVMEKNSTAAKVIPFRQSKLLLVNHEGQPFVPMKPVVEGMGLSWASQTVKLNSNQERWGVSMIETPSSSGIQAYLCIPLRKLFGWLNTIHPNKVRPELRDNIIAYQNECDDALWAYWNDGMAVRRDDRTIETVLSSTIGTDGFHMLGAVLDGKLRCLPAKRKASASRHIWSQIHRAFGVSRGQDIPVAQLADARNFIAAYALEGEWLGKEVQVDGLTLTEQEVCSLYTFMSHYHNACDLAKHMSLTGVAKLFESKPLFNLCDQLSEAGFGFSRLDKRRSEIYSIYRRSCSAGGYAMNREGLQPL